MRIQQELYAHAAVESRLRAKAAMKDPKVAALCKRAREVPAEKWTPTHPVVQAASRALIKAGVTTALGFNFYDLRGPAYFIFPLLTPFIQMIPKQGLLAG